MSSDLALWLAERSRLVSGALRRPAATAHFQSSDSIAGILVAETERQRRIEELDALIAAEEAAPRISDVDTI